MYWLRSGATKISGLALFALAFQFALAFGHFHALHPTSAHLTSPHPTSAHPTSARSEVSASIAFVTSADQDSSDQKSDDNIADYCDICAVTALAHATNIAAPPVLPTPDLVQDVGVKDGTRFRLVELRRLPFQSRGPPQSLG